MDDWVDVKELPEESDIVQVKLENGDIRKAYFYPDKMIWAAFYGHRTSYFYDKTTQEPLFNVTHWLRKEG